MGSPQFKHSFPPIYGIVFSQLEHTHKGFCFAKSLPQTMHFVLLGNISSKTLSKNLVNFKHLLDFWLFIKNKCFKQG